MGLRRWLTTLGLGAGLMYFYDPQNGRRRRAQLNDQWTHMRNETEDFWGKAQRDLQNRAQGVQARAQSLKERASNMPGIGARRGGQGGLHENSRHAQSGVRDGAPDMQGDWSPGVRLLAGLAGGGLTFYGLTRRGLKGTAATLFGFNLISHGVTNTGLRGLINTGENGQSVHFDKTLTVHAPAHEVYEFWRDYHNFPRFMSHVREVRDLGNGRSHWVALGPAGQTVEWDAVITEVEPDRVLAWESLPGAQVHNGGRVRFEPMGDNTTRINVYLAYRPPAGVVGHAVASLFGADPKSAMDDDMVRFKSLLETGKTTMEGREVTKQEMTPAGGEQHPAQMDDTHTASTRSSAEGQPSTKAGPQASGPQSSGPQPTFSSPPGADRGQRNKSQAASVHSMGEDDTDIASGAGRVDEVGHTGVYPASAGNAPGDAEARGMASWGQGDAGAPAFTESGASELHTGADEVDDADIESGKAGFDSMIPGATHPSDLDQSDVYDPSEDD
jgi:uncharacterized membrane protein